MARVAHQRSQGLSLLPLPFEEPAVCWLSVLGIATRSCCLCCALRWDQAGLLDSTLQPARATAVPSTPRLSVEHAVERLLRGWCALWLRCAVQGRRAAALGVSQCLLSATRVLVPPTRLSASQRQPHLSVKGVCCPLYCAGACMAVGCGVGWCCSVHLSVAAANFLGVRAALVGCLSAFWS